MALAFCTVVQMFQVPAVIGSWGSCQQRPEFCICQAILFVHATVFLGLMRVLWTGANLGFLHRRRCQ